MKKITRSILEKFLKGHSSSARVLDVGAGGSSYNKFFPNRISFDVDPERKPDIIGDAHSLPFRDGEFEIVLCTEVLEHVEDPRRVASELYRVIKPGGKLILTTRFVYPFHDAPNDNWRFTRNSLSNLFNSFSKLEIVEESKEFTNLAILVERIILQTSLRGGKITKGILLIISRILMRLDWLVLRRFGSIKKNSEVEEIMSSGYYLVAIK